ncbi:hypothetical protein COLO4_32101 [Corchorus olitorius]|uniref:Uncharacterized protein n=1 Tax=Corchorus olitorius TaxID=93759 RepID=A0A1R3H1J1_9ROSI|nr:hypothetical protein COLO4_32101 [Corchorus olitorius]
MTPHSNRIRHTHPVLQPSPDTHLRFGAAIPNLAPHALQIFSHTRSLLSPSSNPTPLFSFSPPPQQISSLLLSPPLLPLQTRTSISINSTRNFSPSSITDSFTATHFLFPICKLLVTLVLIFGFFLNFNGIAF